MVGVHSFTITVVAALIIAFLFTPLKNRIQILVDKVFYKTSYNNYDTIKKTSKDLVSTMELGRVSSLVVDVLLDTMKLKSAYLLSL